MAIYHTRVKTFSRANGHTSTAAAAYRAGLLLVDDKGVRHDYRRRGGIIDTRCFAPPESPEWALEPSRLWQEAEAAERRRDSTVAREFEISLPHELNDEQRSELVCDVCRDLVGRYGFAAQASIHSPPTDDGLNYHAHILATTRRMRSEGLVDKTRELDGGASGRNEIEWVREMVADRINEHLERAGIEARVDHRSLQAQSDAAIERGDLLTAAMLAREPTQPIGKNATALSRRGANSKRVRKNRQIMDANEEAFDKLLAQFESDGRLMPTSAGHSHLQARQDAQVRIAAAQEGTQLAMTEAAQLWLEDFAKTFQETLAATTKLLRYQAQRVARFVHTAAFRADVRDLVRALKKLKHDVLRFDRKMTAEDRAGHVLGQAEMELARFDNQHPHPGLWTKREWATRRRHRVVAVEARKLEFAAARKATGPQAQVEYQVRVKAGAEALDRHSYGMLKKYPVEADIEPVQIEDDLTIDLDEVSSTTTRGPRLH